jgi:hypothetical protein
MTHISYLTGDKYRERVCRLITDQAESTPLLAITTTTRTDGSRYILPPEYSVGVSRADWLTMRLAILFTPSVYLRGPTISVNIATLCFMPYSASNPTAHVGSAIRIYSDFLDRHEDRQYLTRWRNAVAQLWQYAASYSSRSNRPAININLSRF